MSAPTETGHIVAYLTLNDSQWKQSIASARQDLARLRAERDVDLRIRLDDGGAAAAIAALRAQLAGLPNNTNVGIKVNTSNANQQIRGTNSQVRLLLDSILLLGPAIAPLAAVGAGVAAGLIPTLGATVAGIAGIRDMAKSGALANSQYAGSANAIKSELTQIKAVTAVPLLDGFDRGMQTAAPLFKVINTDAHQMAVQLGDIAANAGPGLLSILTQLDPLFTTIGDDLVSGAAKFQNWATSTGSVQDFVRYAQQELPEVEHVLGSIIRLVVHLGQGLGPLGGVSLASIGVLADLLNALPVGVLRVLLPLLVSTRLAMLGMRAGAAAVNLVGAAYTRAAGTAAAFGSSTIAANLEVQASQAALAASTAQTALTQAEAQLKTSAGAVTAAEAQVAAAATGTAAQKAQAAAALTSAQQQATADAERVTSARSAAVATATAAETSSKRVVAAGAVAATGWRAALGPIGALILILGTLAFAFSDSEDETKTAAEAQQNYTESVKQSTDALNRANVQATVKTLSDGGQYAALQKLTSANSDLKISTNDLTNSVNGSSKAYDSVISKLNAFAEAHSKISQTGNNNARKTYDEEGQAALDLAGDLKTARGELEKKIAAQKLELQAQRAAATIYAGGSAAAGAMAKSLGLSTDAYLDAVTAGRQNTDQLKAQTAAYQQANDAANLFKQTLDILNGKNLDVATAQTTLASANLQVAASLKDNGTAIEGNTEKAVKNQQAIQQQVQSAQAYAAAVGKQTGSSDKATAAYKRSKTQLEAQLRAAGKLTPAMQAYIDKLYQVGRVKVPPTKLDVAARNDKIAFFQARIDAIKQGNVPGLNANSGPGKTIVDELQRRINALHQGHQPTVNVFTGAAKTALAEVQAYLNSLHDKVVTVTVNKAGQVSGTKVGVGVIPRALGGPVGRAAGGDVGPVRGPGTGTSDSVHAMLYRGGQAVREYRLSDGEWIVNAAGRKRNQPALEAANRGATLAVIKRAAGGGVEGIFPSGGPPASGKTHIPVGTVTKDGDGYKYRGQQYSSLEAANNARARDVKAVIKLTTQIDTKGLAAFAKAAHGTAADVRDAFRKIFDDINKAGASDRTLAHLRRLDDALVKTARLRDHHKAALGAPTRNTQTAYEKLEAARDAYRQTRSSTAATARGSFDIAQAGGTEGGGVAFGSIQAQAKQKANLVTKYVAGIKKLAKTLGKSKTGNAMLKQLIDAGPGAYPQVQALLNASPAGLASLLSSQATINAQSAALGTYAADRYNKGAVTKAQNRVAALQAAIRRDDQRAERQARIIAKAVRSAVKGLRMEIGGQPVGRAVRKGNKRNDRRN